MELTRLQLGFLIDLRTGACRAAAGLDAGVIGPLIRANLVRWDDDPAEAAKRRRPPGTTFALTSLGAQSLAEHEARHASDGIATRMRPVCPRWVPIRRCKIQENSETLRT